MDERTKERLRTLTVEVLLEARAAYLVSGANPMRHWDQLQNRMLSAARRSATAEEWVTALWRGLQLPAPSSSASQALRDLTAKVVELGCATAWLELIEREFGVLIAMARGCAEARAAARGGEVVHG